MRNTFMIIFAKKENYQKTCFSLLSLIMRPGGFDYERKNCNKSGDTTTLIMGRTLKKFSCYAGNGFWFLLLFNEHFLLTNGLSGFRLNNLDLDPAN